MAVGPFNQGTRELCFEVSIINDIDPERDECFSIGFDSDLASVVIDPPSVKVTIIDDDCKLPNNISTLRVHIHVHIHNIYTYYNIYVHIYTTWCIHAALQYFMYEWHMIEQFQYSCGNWI